MLLRFTIRSCTTPQTDFDAVDIFRRNCCTKDTRGSCALWPIVQHWPITKPSFIMCNHYRTGFGFYAVLALVEVFTYVILMYTQCMAMRCHHFGLILATTFELLIIVSKDLFKKTAILLSFAAILQRVKANILFPVKYQQTTFLNSEVRNCRVIVCQAETVVDLQRWTAGSWREKRAVALG